MGKTIRINVNILRSKIDELIGQLAGIAYKDTPVEPIGDLDWDDPVPISYRTVSLVTSGLSGASVDGTFPQQVENGSSVTINVVQSVGYLLDTVSYKIGEDGELQSAEVVDGSAEITLTNITSDITVYLYSTATQLELHGTDINGDPVEWETGYFQSSYNNDPNTRNNADGAFSDFLPASFNVGDELVFDMGALYIGTNENVNIPYIEFYNSSKTYIGHIGQTQKPRSWTVPSGNQVLNAAYIRVSAYFPAIGSVYVKRNNDYLFKGDEVTETS